MSEETVFIFEAPEIVKPELRLYYDESGKVLCYSCENFEGNYIVIDAQTYAECRHDIKVIDGKIVRDYKSSFISRLYTSDEGILCDKEDISVIVESDGTYWTLITHEL